jgi:hypothetical protein
VQSELQKNSRRSERSGKPGRRRRRTNERLTRSVLELPLSLPMVNPPTVLLLLAIKLIDPFNFHQSVINLVLKFLANTNLLLAVFNNSRNMAATPTFNTLATQLHLMVLQTRYNGGPAPKYDH